MEIFYPFLTRWILAGPSPGRIGSWLKGLHTDQPFLYAFFTVALLLAIGLTLGAVVEFVLSAIGYGSEEIDYEE